MAVEGSMVEEILVRPVPKTGWVGSGGGVRLIAACRRGGGAGDQQRLEQSLRSYYK